jgi:hypothetical protein
MLRVSSQIGGLIDAGQRRSFRLVLGACPRPGVRARVLPAWVRSPGKKPELFPCHPGAAGKGKTGRVNRVNPR